MDAEDYDTASRAFRTVAMMKPFNVESQEGATNEQKADANYYLAWLSYREVTCAKPRCSPPRHWPRTRNTSRPWP